jgi:hypothetical protein
MGFDLKQFQMGVAGWRARNFPNTHNERHLTYAMDPLIGVLEELGELSHAHLKMRQGIRGDSERHIVAAKDAVGDIVVYLADYCSRMGFSLEECTTMAWESVQKRDWVKYPETGRPK